MALNLFSRKQASPKKHGLAKARRPGRLEDYKPAAPLVLEKDPYKQCFQLERYGVIAANREGWQTRPGCAELYSEAVKMIDDLFALVPEGYASLPQMIHDRPGCPEMDVETDAFLLGRYTVTNEQFQKFVDGKGYENLELWPEDIWPHLIDFQDLTGRPGPRYWEQGRHDQRLADHPVVGISYYEAEAYCRWAGYRLPTESEWQMAASWRLRSSAYVLRRYPWGDALDTDNCNIWASGLGRTVPVTSYESGAAPNGVQQLIGNVWEWTSTDYCVFADDGQPVLGDMLLKSIRGGAFDTYFPSQATSFFRTGLTTITRAHNVGIRCAMSLPGEGKGEAGA